MPSISPISRPHRLRLFAAEYIKNGCQAQKAALSVGFTKNPASAAVIAHRLLNDVNWPIAVEECMQESKMSADEVLERLTKVARSDVDVKGSDVVKANELLGKFHKLFVDRVESTDTSVAEGVSAGLLQSIADAAKRDRITDGEAAVGLFAALRGDPAFADVRHWPSQFQPALTAYIAAQSSPEQPVIEAGDQ